MEIIVEYAFIYLIGSITGWILEVFFRRFFSSANPERKWINPGFCTGPYLPLYGAGLCAMHALSTLDKVDFTGISWINYVIMFAIMSVTITAIEFLSGLFHLKFNNVRLWDYSQRWGNVMGLICPKFSLVWTILCIGYYFLLHRGVSAAAEWIGHGNMLVIFVLGLLYGVMIVDIVVSINLVNKIKTFAIENNVIVKYEEIKLSIIQFKEKQKEKYHFLFPFKTNRPISEYLKELAANLSEKVSQEKERIRETIKKNKKSK